MAERALATAFVNVVPGTKDFESMLKGQLAGKMPGIGDTAGTGFNKGFGGALGRLGGVLTAALSVGAITHFTKSLIDAANAEVVGNARLENITKSMGLFGANAGEVSKRLEDLATKQQLANGIDDDSIKLTMSKLMTFKELAKTADDAGGAFDRATQAALDMAASGFGSAESNAVQLGKALNDPIKGITALGRAGITFTETEKKRIETLVKSNEMGAAQALVLKAIETQVGGTASATATASDRMKQGYENLKETIGMALLPKFNEFATYLSTTVLPAATTFFEAFKAGKTPLNDIGTAIGNFTNFVRDNWSWISALGVALLAAYASVKLVNTAFTIAAGIQKGYAAAVALVNGVIALYKIATGQATLAQLGMNAAMLANPIGLIVAAVAALVAGLIWFFTQTKLGQTIWANFTKFLGEAIHNIGAWFGSVWKSIVAGWNNVITWFRNLPGVIMGALANAGSWLLGIGKNIIDGLIAGLKNGAGMVGQWFANMGHAWISQFKAIFGIKSPSKVFKEFGKNIMQGLHAGLTGEKGTVTDAMTKVSEWLTNAFNDKKISKAQVQAGRKLVAAYGAQLKALESQHSELMEKLDKAQKDLADKIAERADYIKGLAEKFGSALTIDTTAASADDIAAATNDVAKAQEKYNSILKDTEASLTDVEDARLSLAAAEKKLAKAQNPGTTFKSAADELRARIAKTKELKAVTDKLIAMGLNKSLYKQIVEAGAVDFAESILAGGTAAVGELNVLSEEADKQALDLATKVGDTLFNEGIRFAEAVVAGLEKDKTKLEAIMDAVALAFEKHMLEIVKGSTEAITSAMTGAAAEAKAVVDAAIAAAKGPVNVVVTTVTKPLVGLDQTGGTLNRSTIGGKYGTMIAMASGGFVTGPTPALIGEAGPEVVTPLKDFERMMGMNNTGPSITYVAAPNQSLDAEQALFQAIKRAKVVGAW